MKMDGKGVIIGSIKNFPLRHGWRRIKGLPFGCDNNRLYPSI